MVLQNIVGGRNETKGPRLNELGVQGSDMDVPIPIIYGSVRTAGNIYWSTGLKETKRKEKVGKGGGTNIVNYEYRSSFAVGFCVGEIKRPLKIWFGNKLIYDYNGGNPTGAQLNYNSAGGFYLAGAKKGTWKHSRLWVYQGTERQTVNPIIEEDLGVGKAPAFRGQVIIVVEDLELDYWGNQIPPVTAIFEDVKEWTAAEVCADICERVGIDADRDCDFSELENDVVEGFILKDTSAARSYLDMIGLAYGCEFANRNGKITAVKYGRDAYKSIPDHELRVVEDGESEPGSTIWSREQESEIPQRLQIQYLDKHRNYFPNSQSAHRQVTDAEGQEAISLPMVMDGAGAMKIAERELYRRWIEREEVNIQVPWKHLDIGPCDVITINTKAGPRNVRVQGGQIPFVGPISLTAVLDYGGAHDWPEPQNTTPPEYDTIVELGEPEILMFQAHSYSDPLNERPVIYAAAATPEGTAYDTIIIDPIQGTPGDTIGLTERAGIGHLLFPLGDWKDTDRWDEENDIIVFMKVGGLETASIEEVLNGYNAAFIESATGWEIVQFRNAELIGTEDLQKTFRLTGLLRGRRGTEMHTSGHSAGDRFLLIDSAVEVVQLPMSAIGLNTAWEVHDYEGSSVVNHLITAPNLKPYAPVNLKGIRDESGDLQIAWTRRSRYLGAALNSPPLGESEEKYVLRVFDSEDETVRKVTLNEPQYTYVLSDRTSDGFAPEEPVQVEIVMVSEEVGEGYPLKGEV